MTSAEFNHSVEQHSDSLFRYALHFLKNSGDAQDVVQDAFEKLWLNREKVVKDKVKSWLFTCVHHAMLNQVHRKKTQQAHLDSLDKAAFHKPDSSFESKQVIDQLVSSLPPLQKSILLLRDLEGYSYEEIGDLLSIPSAQVKVYLFRARLKIKKQLKGIFELA
ncbi:MAG: RNA polymerase sigma factor [Crocinitomicaceae bacterium]